MVFRYARALRGLGIGPGKLVALFAPNDPEAVAIRYAASLIGAPSVYLARPAEPARREALLAETGPALLIVFPGTAAAGADRPPQAQVASVGAAPGAGQRIDQLAAGQSADPLECAADPDHLGVIVSSGGTTGVPKGSCRSFAAYTVMVDLPSRPGRRQLIATPLAYLAQILVDATLLGGGTVIMRDDFTPQTLLEAITAERVTDVFLVEPALFELMDQPALEQWDLSSLRNITHVGASAPEVLRRRAERRLGDIIQHTYGSSEMGVVSTLRPGEAVGRPELAGTAGRILPGVEVAFRRPDGSLAPAHEGGAVEVRSAAMASGYWHRPEDQAAAFADGWYRSGDIAFTDSSGYLHYVGRAPDLESTGGASLTCRVQKLCNWPRPGISSPRSGYCVVLIDQASEHGCAPDPVRGERDDARVVSRGAQIQGAVRSAGVVMPDVPVYRFKTRHTGFELRLVSVGELRHDHGSCLSVCCTCSCSGCSAGWSCWAAAKGRRTRRSWCCGMR
jgi:fatty-acyl-CoA synthase